MKPITAEQNLVAYCGLYCGACRSYLRGKCPGCHENGKAAWCKVRSCCIGNNYCSCADCKEFSDPNDCRQFNNVVSKIFGIIFRSDRAACIGQIKAMGMAGHSERMADLKIQTLSK